MEEARTGRSLDSPDFIHNYVVKLGKSKVTSRLNLQFLIERTMSTHMCL